MTSGARPPVSPATGWRWAGFQSRVVSGSPERRESSRAAWSACLERSAAVTEAAPASSAAKASGPGPLPRSSTVWGFRGSSERTPRACR